MKGAIKRTAKIVQWERTGRVRRRPGCQNAGPRDKKIHAEAWIFPFPAAEKSAAERGLDVHILPHEISLQREREAHGLWRVPYSDSRAGEGMA